ncbi:MAG: UDP-2,3-diacylglucosamine diphosphatase [Bdellovibrionaceae bacterium]|nr:UDP-2,3-diacylglucosamine diphosphatase [Pseudobdellovibrionaceae bacterium]
MFLSDLHLTSLQGRNGETLLRFLSSLEALPSPPERIFLLGDIFDLWVSKHRVFVERYRPMLDSLARLRERGSKILYFEGNHDMHLAPYWEKQLGAEVHVGPALFEVGGLRIRCEHGDEINHEDFWYLLMRSILRHPVLEMTAHFLPGRFWDGLGQRWSRKSRRRSTRPRPDRDENIRRMIRAHAEKVWEEDPFDAIISGHMHVRDDWSFERAGKTVRAINLGSWHREAPVLILDQGRFEWRSL